MKRLWTWLQLALLLALLCLSGGQSETSEENDGVSESGENTSKKRPTVFVAILARNTAHTLPYFFSYIDRLDYPKDRMHIWIRTDNNVDNTSSVIEEWINNVRSFYHQVDFANTSKYDIDDASTPYEWSDKRYYNVIYLRQQALDEARRAWADYLMFIDCDNFLADSRILNILIEENKPIIAPMLTVNKDESYFSNFWCGVDNRGYYKRTEEYVPTLRRTRKGTYEVPMVHSTFLIDLRLEASTKLAYWPPSPTFDSDVDDMLLFRHSASETGMTMHVINKEIYGFLPQPYNYQTVEDATLAFNSFKVDALVDFPPLVTSEYITPPPEQPSDTMGFDHVYMINLERRPDRRLRMNAALNELHIDFEWFKAVDGRELNDSYADDLNIKMLPGWKDPWGDRPITKGEIGCFLSHYFIWEKMVDEGWRSVLIFEDDIKFIPYFRDWMEMMLGEIKDNNLEWDLIYVGRKRLFIDEEYKLDGLETLITPKYSYWTLCYMLSLSGAKKLLAQNPLQKILPVDEYFPIMFDDHPKEEWSKYFWPRDLIVYSANPLFVTPTHYVGDEEYFSDTEPLHVFRALNQKQKDELEERKKKNFEDKEDYMRSVHSEL